MLSRLGRREEGGVEMGDLSRGWVSSSLWRDCGNVVVSYCGCYEWMGNLRDAFG